MSDEAGFLSRWARRKQAALRGEAPAGEGPAAVPATAAEPVPAAERLPGLAAPPDDAALLPEPLPRDREVPALLGSDPGAPEPLAGDPGAAEPFDVASLPPVELLDAKSDFSVFLKPGVPAALRSAALRKAWTADPLIRDYLSPLDYGWDFNAPGGLPFGFSDALGESAGKVMQLIRQAIGEPEPPPDPDAPPAEPVPEALPLEELAVEAVPVAEAAPLVPTQAEPEPSAPPLRRHGGALPA